MNTVLILHRTQMHKVDATLPSSELLNKGEAATEHLCMLSSDSLPWKPHFLLCLLFIWFCRGLLAKQMCKWDKLSYWQYVASHDCSVTEFSIYSCICIICVVGLEWTNSREVWWHLPLPFLGPRFDLWSGCGWPSSHCQQPAPLHEGKSWEWVLGCTCWKGICKVSQSDTWWTCELCFRLYSVCICNVGWVTGVVN